MADFGAPFSNLTGNPTVDELIFFHTNFWTFVKGHLKK